MVRQLPEAESGMVAVMEKPRVPANAESSIARKNKTVIPDNGGELASDVEKVLEHVSSPFRWELLDIPKLKSKAERQEKHIIQKTRNRK
jgi:hypothetical protein